MKMPATSEETPQKPSMSAGLQLVKVVEIKQWLNDKGEQKKDDRGWPGIEIVLMNKAKETVSFTNYYCDKPLNSDIRKDPNLRCKSEFYLTRFKQALNLPMNEVDDKDIIGKKLYVPIGELHIVDSDGKAVYGSDGKPIIYTELVKQFFPFKDGEAPPDLVGDPLLNKGVAAGIFYRAKQSTKKSETTSEHSESSSGKVTTEDGDEF
jgi:hypothetical protein